MYIYIYIYINICHTLRFFAFNKGFYLLTMCNVLLHRHSKTI